MHTYRHIEYLVLYALLAIVYLAGMQIPLMENDAAQHAAMAMQMTLEGDYLNLYKGQVPYLDKPHMHFWLAALSFKVFGVSQWAYRIPAFLFTILGAYSCFRLAKRFYGKQASHLAACIFLSAQAIFLANHDVRTDAVLTGATIFGIWQLVSYLQSQKLIAIILGAIGMGVAFSTKGQLGVFVIGLCLLLHLSYTRQWKALWSWKIGVGILAFVLTIFPVLFAYYSQFDQHPELVVNGTKHVSGVQFILWDQSFNRLTANGFKKTSQGYFFFFHSLLWAFFPWAIYMYLAWTANLWRFAKSKWKYQKGLEALSSAGVLCVVLVISFSKFKLPHYLNSILPMLSVLVAGYLVRLHEEKKRLFWSLLHAHLILLGLVTIGILSLIFWAFPLPHGFLLVCDILLLAVLWYVCTKKMDGFKKITYGITGFMIMINFCLNTQFYPELLKYQAGNQAAKIIKSEGISITEVFATESRPSWSLDFYTNQTTPLIDPHHFLGKIKKGNWIFAYEKDKKELEKHAISWSTQYEMQHYRVTRLHKTFLNPNTRSTVLEKAYLLQVKAVN